MSNYVEKARKAAEARENVTRAALKESIKKLYGSAGIDTSGLQAQIDAYVNQGGTEESKIASQAAFAEDQQHYLEVTRNLLERNATNKEANIEAYEGLLNGANFAGIDQKHDVLEKMKERTNRLTEHAVDANPSEELSAHVFDVKKIEGSQLPAHLMKAEFIFSEYSNSQAGRPSEQIYVIRGMITPFTFDKPPETPISNPFSQQKDINRTARLITFYALASNVKVIPKPYDVIDVKFPKPNDFSFGIFTGNIKKTGTAPKKPIAPKNAFGSSNGLPLGLPGAR